jgi:hypothetical protein
MANRSSQSSILSRSHRITSDVWGPKAKLAMLELIITFIVGCAVGYAVWEMLSRYRRERERQRHRL